MEGRTNRVDRAQKIFSNAEITKNRESNNLKSLMKNLELALRKELKLWWDTTTLNAYIDKKMIPRGLRIKKVATGIQTADFTKKWEDTLSECSLKLMLLIVEHEQEQLKTLEQEILTLNKDIEPLNKMSEYEGLNRMILDNLSQLEDVLATTKQGKFQRDLSDYENGQIYTWKTNKRRDTRAQPRRKYTNEPSGHRQVGFSDSERSNYRSDYPGGETSDSSYDGTARQNRGRGNKKNPKNFQDPSYASNRRFNPPPQAIPKNGGRGGVGNIVERRYPERTRSFKQNYAQY